MKKLKAKQISAIVSIVLTFTIVFGMGSVWAKESNQNDVYKSIKTYYSEVTDLNELLQMVINKDKNLSRLASPKNDVFDISTQEKEDITITQLLSKTITATSTVYEYVTSSLLVQDELGVRLKKSDVVSLSTRSSTINQSGSKYGVTAVVKLYFTAVFNGSIVNGKGTIRVNKSSTQIVNNINLITVNKIIHGYHIYVDIYDKGKIATVYSPSRYTEYFVYSTDTTDYPYWGGLQNQIYTAASIFTSQGTFDLTATVSTPQYF